MFAERISLAHFDLDKYEVPLTGLTGVATTKEQSDENISMGSHFMRDLLRLGIGAIAWFDVKRFPAPAVQDSAPKPG
jgi:hypothetical protein